MCNDAASPCVHCEASWRPGPCVVTVAHIAARRMLLKVFYAYE